MDEDIFRFYVWLWLNLPCFLTRVYPYAILSKAT
jgi:hypothetical protein